MDAKGLDEMIKDIFENDSNSIKGIGDIEVPNMDMVMNKLIMKDSNNHNVLQFTPKVKKNRKIMKKIIFAACIFMTIFIISIFTEVPYARAFKFRIVKTIYNIKDNIITIIHKDNKAETPVINSKDSLNKLVSIDQVNELPFRVYIPKYLPSDYRLSNILWKQYPDNMHIVEQLYIKDNNKTISLIQTENRPDENIETNIKSDNSNVEIIDINGINITIISTNGNITNAIWYKDNTKFEIVACCSKDETINIIKSLK